MKSISLKSHNSRDFERCIECTSTAICYVSIWRHSVCCQRASDPPGIPVAKPLQVGEYSHSFTSPCKLAKATSCSSDLSKAPGQGDYFFLGAYMLTMCSALSFNEIKNPMPARVKSHWWHTCNLVCNPRLVPITMCPSVPVPGEICWVCSEMEPLSGHSFYLCCWGCRSTSAS